MEFENNLHQLNILTLPIFFVVKKMIE